MKVLTSNSEVQVYRYPQESRQIEIVAPPCNSIP